MICTAYGIIEEKISSKNNGYLASLTFWERSNIKESISSLLWFQQVITSNDMKQLLSISFKEVKESGLTGYGAQVIRAAFISLKKIIRTSGGMCPFIYAAYILAQNFETKWCN